MHVPAGSGFGHTAIVDFDLLRLTLEQNARGSRALGRDPQPLGGGQLSGPHGHWHVSRGIAFVPHFDSYQVALTQLPAGPGSPAPQH